MSSPAKTAKKPKAADKEKKGKKTKKAVAEPTTPPAPAPPAPAATAAVPTNNQAPPPANIPNSTGLSQLSNILGTGPPLSFPIPGEIYTGRHLTHYDETSGIAIPASEIDSHTRKNHQVRTLIDAYSERYERLRMLLTTKLLPKREHLLQIYRKLKENSDAITMKGKIIEKETLTDAERILERLKSVISLRQSAIQHELIHVEEELQSIERIMRRVERANQVDNNPTGIVLTSVNPTTATNIPIYSNPTIMVEVIQEFGELAASINQMANKLIQLQVDFPTEDFPRETSERLEILNRCDRYVHALQVKDHMLWLAMQEKEKLSQSLQEERELSQEYALEVSRWADITQRHQQEIAVLQAEKKDLERKTLQLRQVLLNNGIYVE